MDNKIFKLSIYGLTPSYPEGMHFSVGQTRDGSRVESIVFMDNIFQKNGLRVYRIKTSVPDKNGGGKGFIHTSQEIKIGSMHTDIITNDSRPFANEELT